MSSWLNHRELFLVRGVYRAPGDPNSVERPIISINLMQNGTGIALASDGWTPQLPQLKSEGVWADSPIQVGRTLLAGTDSNIKETLAVIITGPDMLTCQRTLMTLYNMQRDCRQFWTDNAQIDPVYLHWWASCGAGPQYALIYNLDVAPEFKDAPRPTIEATITIEREAYWRAVPPGANPAQWTFEAAGTPYTYRDTQIITPLVGETGENRSELSLSAATYSLISDNSITIPASSIPGDAPALMLFKIANVTADTQAIIGKKTTKITQYASVPTGMIAQNLIHNACDGVLGTDATLVADTGASKDFTTGTAQRVSISFATATNQNRWTSSTTLSHANRFVGRFMVFLRCRQNGGSLGDISMYLRYGYAASTDTDGQKLNVAYPQVIAGAGNTTNWGLTYMGVVQIPLVPAKADVNVGSNASTGVVGLEGSTGNNVLFSLFAARSTGAGVLYLNDLIFIPIDEGSMTLEFADSAGGAYIFYDETGYMTHGSPEQYTFINPSALLGGATHLVKYSGSGIQLTPGVENRLYFICYDTNKQSVISHAPTLGVSIVPRWKGIRDR